MYEISYLICDPRNIIIGSSFEFSLYLAQCCWLYIMCNEAVFCQQFASRNWRFSLVVVFSFCLLHFIVFWKTRERFWTTWYEERLNIRRGYRKPEHHVVRADKFRVEFSLYLAQCCWLYIMCNEAVFCQQFASINWRFSLVVVFSFCLLHFTVYWKTRERFWTTRYEERLNIRRGYRKPEHYVVRADKFPVIPPYVSKRNYCSRLFTYKKCVWVHMFRN